MKQRRKKRHMSEQTYTRIVQIIVLLLFVLGLIYADPFPPASAQAPAKRDDRYVSDCTTLAGISKARCERHERMYEKYHAIRGEAHHECDRQFILASPLDCSTLSADDARVCEQEREAVRACSAESGRGFLRCMSGLLRADPRH